RGEFLEEPDRIGGAQNRHRAGETDPLGARRGGAEDDDRGRVEELTTVMLPDPERIDPQLVRALDLLDEIADAVGGAARAAVLGERGAKLSMPISMLTGP